MSELLRRAADTPAGDVADALRDAIVSGLLPAGAKLRQSEVGTAFGVSRTPAREALHKLNAWGLVELVVNHAAVVRRIDRAAYAGMFVVWAELAGLAAELAAPGAAAIEQRLADAVAQERQIVDQLIASRGAPRAERLRRRWIAAHAAFHEAVLDAAGSGRLRDTIETTTAILTRERLWEAIADRPYPLQRSVAERARLAELLRERRAAAAGDAMRAHVRALGERFLEWREAAPQSEALP